MNIACYAQGRYIQLLGLGRTYDSSEDIKDAIRLSIQVSLRILNHPENLKWKHSGWLLLDATKDEDQLFESMVPEPHKCKTLR